MEDSKKVKGKEIAKTLIFLAVGIFLVWLVMRNLSEKDKAEISASFNSASVYLLALIVLFGLLSNYVRAIRWQMMMEATGKKPGIINTFLAVNVAYLANLAVPRLGEVSRCGVLNRYEGISIDKSLGTVITERIVDMISLLVVCLLTVLLQYSILQEGIHKWIMQPMLNKFGHLNVQYVWLLILIIAGALIPLIWFRKQIGNLAVIKKVMKLSSGFGSGLKSVGKLDRKGLFVLYTVLIWIFYLLAIFTGFKALPDTAHLGFGPALAILFFGTFAFIAVQGGIGAYQIIVMNTLMLYGVSSNAGFALGWLVWGIQAAGTIILGGLSLLILSLINKKQK